MPRVKCLEIAGLLIVMDFVRERAHIQIYSGNPKRPAAECKIWLDTLEVARSRGFNGPTLNRILKLVEKYQRELLNEYETLFK